MRVSLIGLRVNHIIMGEGIIIEEDPPYLKIKFGHAKRNPDKTFLCKSLIDKNFFDSGNRSLIEAYIQENIGPVLNNQEPDENVPIDVNDLVFALRKIADAIVLEHPNLGYNDIRLALTWTSLDHKFKKIDDISALVENFGRNYELGRVLSARAAEKAAIYFYKKLYRNVRDISILQITNNEISEWRDFDIKVEDAHFVDVKNARRSQTSYDRYVEHCVSKFKAARSGNDEVHIAGLLSPYVWASDLIGQEMEGPAISDRYPRFHKDPIIFLGETSAKKHLFLLDKFQNPQFQMINFQTRYSTNSFLPPWVYDLPKDIYKKRDSVIKRLRKTNDLLKMLDKSRNRLNLFPFAIAFDLWDGASKFDNFGAIEREFALYIIEGIRDYGLSLPYLFLSILKHFLSCIERGIYSFDPQNYSQIIYFEKSESFPLFMCDPLGIIRELINSLSILWRMRIHEIMKFKKFRLYGPNILQGSMNGDHIWKTIIAYCGGRKLSDNSKCGKYPLVLGESETCQECGKLICPACNFCQINCISYQERTREKSRR